ncbi:MAG TPA: O-antigen ligase [Candidatus Binataceae bacterium]|nr:O-antigen ligase [Candidatus Binataceae bacterium]
MLTGSTFSPSPGAQKNHLLLLGLCVVIALVTVWVINTQPTFLFLAIAAAAFVAVIAWAVPYTIRHTDWLICPLVLTVVFIASGFLSDATRATIHYGLVVLFCLPAMFKIRRSGILWQGGFKLYIYYFVWAAATITYSLSPMFSVARLGDAVLMFSALTLISLEVNALEDLRRVWAHLLLACTVIELVLVAVLVALPSSITFQAAAADEAMGASQIPRFVGIFSEPNEVGVVMLITVGAAAVYWPWASRKQKILLGILMALATMCSAFADSRTPFLALAVGATGYILWKYRWRGVLILLVGAALFAGLQTVGGRFGDYFNRDVGTLTGRTDIWDFAVQQIKAHPVLGYGYAVSGEIFDSRYFPIWWGPWDLGPHSSLHDGYLDHAIGVGVPATLLWLFIMGRPWLAAFRRKDDPLRLKPVFFLMVLPMLIHNLTEASIGDCLGSIGLVFGLTWAIAERHRLIRLQEDSQNQREAMAKLPRAVMALASALILTLGLTAYPFHAFAADTLSLPQTGNGSTSIHFSTLPPHAQLPSSSECAALVSSDRFEPRPNNYTANHTVPTAEAVADFHAHPIKGAFAPLSAFSRIDGQFTGTTDQILRWSACKWGIDEDVVRAEAVVESHWRQDDLGDRTTDRSLCPEGDFKGAWDGNTCWQSYGILQMKYSNWGGWPWSKNSTAFNSDCRFGYMRACMNGDIHYLGDKPPPPGYPAYAQGTPDEMLWGCMGDYYSGNWFDQGAVKYNAEVKEALATKPWLKSRF